MSLLHFNTYTRQLVRELKNTALQSTNNYALCCIMHNLMGKDKKEDKPLGPILFFAISECAGS